MANKKYAKRFRDEVRGLDEDDLKKERKKAKRMIEKDVDQRPMDLVPVVGLSVYDSVMYESNKYRSKIISMTAEMSKCRSVKRYLELKHGKSALIQEWLEKWQKIHLKSSEKDGLSEEEKNYPKQFIIQHGRILGSGRDKSWSNIKIHGHTYAQTTSSPHFETLVMATFLPNTPYPFAFFSISESMQVEPGYMMEKINPYGYHQFWPSKPPFDDDILTAATCWILQVFAAKMTEALLGMSHHDLGKIDNWGYKIAQRKTVLNYDLLAARLGLDYFKIIVPQGGYIFMQIDYHRFIGSYREDAGHCCMAADQLYKISVMIKKPTRAEEEKQQQVNKQLREGKKQEPESREKKRRQEEE